MNDFLLPGVFDPLQSADAAALHLAGLESVAVAFDPHDIFPNDTDSEVIGTDESPHLQEFLPQFGPPFVKRVMQRFDTLEQKIAEQKMRKWDEEARTWFGFATFNTDGSGNANRSEQPNSIFLETEPGWTWALHRLSIAVGGSNFGTPYTAAASYWELRSNDEFIDGASLVSGSGQFPVVKTWGTRDAPHIRDGEIASIFIVGGAGLASKSITVKAQGTMKRDPDA